MSYTKGPWHIGTFKNTQYLKVYATNDDLEIICNIAEDKILHNKVQDFEANSKLIAAAPNLLEACQNALNDIEKLNIQLISEGKHGYVLMENELNAAIIKAVGV